VRQWRKRVNITIEANAQETLYQANALSGMELALSVWGMNVLGSCSHLLQLLNHMRLTAAEAEV
jgi:hypothetical protein